MPTSRSMFAQSAPLQTAWARSWPLGLAAGLLSLAPLVFMFQVYGDVSQSKSADNIWAMLGLLAWVLLITEWMNHQRSRLLQQAGKTALADLRETWSIALTRDPQRLGARTSAMQADLQLLQEACSLPVLLAIFESPVSVIFIGLLWWIHPGFLAVVAAILLVQIVHTWRSMRREQQAVSQNNRLSQHHETWLNRLERCRPAVLSMGMLHGLSALWQRDLHAQSQRDGQVRNHQSGRASSQRALQLLTGSLMIGAGAWLLIMDQLQGNAGLLIVASSLGAKVLAPLTSVVSQANRLIRIQRAYTRVNDTLKDIAPQQSGMQLPPPSGHLKAMQLSAAPVGAHTPLLRGIQFDLPAGQMLAVVGHTGSGKSALLRTLAGQWSKHGGELRLDGVDLASWSRETLGPYLGYLPDTLHPQAGSFQQIVTRWCDDEPLEHVLQRFPQHWFDFVGHGARQWQSTETAFAPLSRGERQRLAIAAAWSPEVRLLLLDTPETGLDDTAIAGFTALLRQARTQGVTIVLVSRRIEWLQLADQWLFMEAGRMRLYGPRVQVQQQLAQRAET